MKDQGESIHYVKNDGTVTAVLLVGKLQVLARNLIHRGCKFDHEMGGW